MITLNVIIEVRKLANSGLSQRKIAKIVGISRDSIQQILKGPMPCVLREIDVVCELCGKEGKLYTDKYYLQTLCLDCRERKN